MGMISVVICGCEDSEGLARTLAVLVEGVVEGLICEAFVIDEGLDPACLEIAEQAGCKIVGSSSSDIVAASRGDWLLLLEAGALPDEGWVQVVARHMASSRKAASFRDRRWFFNTLPRALRKPLALGLLVQRSDALIDTREGKGFDTVARNSRVSLDASIVPAKK